MSLRGPIDLPSPLREGTHYTKNLLSEYLCALTPAGIRADVAAHGYYLAKGESDVHEDRALEKVKEKLEIFLKGEVESRKNSWTNSLNRNLNNGDDKAVASMLASIWRRYLTETSLRKAELSVLGYTLNGNQRCKTKRVKEINALCEYCHKEIMMLLNKGFTCPHCNAYFVDFKPQKMKIKSYAEPYYEEFYDEIDNVIDRVRTGALSLERTASKLKNAAQLSLF